MQKGWLLFLDPSLSLIAEVLVSEEIVFVSRW